MQDRKRNHWGWGWDDKFADREERQGLGQMVEALLGLTGLETTEPMALEAIELLPSRGEVDANLRPFCTTAGEDRIRHTYGRSYIDVVRGFRGDFKGAPDIVAYPRDEEDILAVFEWAKIHDAKIVPFGGGTSVVGGVEADRAQNTGPVLSLDLRELTGLYELDTTSRLALFGAGTLGPAIEDSLSPHGLTLRHFPQSFEFSTLGGWLATRAGGHFATVYTHIDDLTESIRMVTPTGILETPRVPASGAGPCPNRLILGSEGALGVITRAWMRVRERPRFRSKANVLFTDFDRAIDATRAIAQSYLHPTNCRLLDAREAMLNGVVQDGSHVLLLGFESATSPTDTMMQAALDLADGHKGRCPEGPSHVDEANDDQRKDAARRWRQSFLEAPYLQNNLVSLGVIA
ncbi:MAG: FAD-binding oxidoreductase, partial [Bradymonadaceae bacterium]